MKIIVKQDIVQEQKNRINVYHVKIGYYLTEENICKEIAVSHCLESTDGETCIKCEVENK